MQKIVSRWTSLKDSWLEENESVRLLKIVLEFQDLVIILTANQNVFLFIACNWHKHLTIVSEMPKQILLWSNGSWMLEFRFHRMVELKRTLNHLVCPSEHAYTKSFIFVTPHTYFRNQKYTFHLKFINLTCA